MKGFQEVIKLIPEFKRSDISVRYLIAGVDDGYKENLIHLIRSLNLENSVEFVGFLNLEEKKQYIKQCDIFAVPSIYEPFGLVALEGMILNKTILTSNSTGLKEVLNDYKKKIYIFDKDIIQKIKNIPDFGQEVINEKFNWENINKLYLKLLVLKY